MDFKCSNIVNQTQLRPILRKKDSIIFDSGEVPDKDFLRKKVQQKHHRVTIISMVVTSYVQHILQL